MKYTNAIILVIIFLVVDFIQPHRVHKKNRQRSRRNNSQKLCDFRVADKNKNLEEFKSPRRNGERRRRKTQQPETVQNDLGQEFQIFETNEGTNDKFDKALKTYLKTELKFDDDAQLNMKN